MKKPTDSFVKKKVIKKESLKAEHRIARPKKKNKAVLKRELFINCAKGIAHLEVYNRIIMKDEKINHLSKSLTFFEKCLQQEPGNHLLRDQFKICKEALFNIEQSEDKSDKGRIEILLDYEEF